MPIVILELPDSFIGVDGLQNAISSPSEHAMQEGHQREFVFQNENCLHGYQIPNANSKRLANHALFRPHCLLGRYLVGSDLVDQNARKQQNGVRVTSRRSQTVCEGSEGILMSLIPQPVCEPGPLGAVFSVSPIEKDQRDLRTILSDWHAPIESARTVQDALGRLLRGATPLILCERDLPDGNWKLLFQQTERLPRPPRFIISSRLANDHLWVEVLNLGGQDVLQTPFVAHEVRHAVQCGWDAWQRLWAPATMSRAVELPKVRKWAN